MSTISIELRRDIARSVSTRNSKMPGSSVPMDAFACGVGSRLAKVAESVCSACYARRLQVFRSNVAAAWARNQRAAEDGIGADPEAWAGIMASQIGAAADKSGQPYHRWFDSGDLASVAMLAAIVRVAELTPHVQHWLPTREVAIVRRFLVSGGAFPSNLVVRVSSPLVDDKPLPGWSHTSTVHKRRDPAAAGAHVCPARHQGNSCGDCRACWSRDVASVSYPKH